MQSAPKNAGRFFSDMFSHFSVVVDQVMFLTESGSLGIGPLSLQRGDTLWLFAGGNMTFAMRQKTSAGSSVQLRQQSLDNEYMLLGSSYHNQIMHAAGGEYKIPTHPEVCVIT